MFKTAPELRRDHIEPLRDLLADAVPLDPDQL
jgi:hypothetical protein